MHGLSHTTANHIVSDKEKDSQEILVFITRKEGSCADCGKELHKGNFITLNREKGVLCLDCGDLGHLDFLPSGNTALTRRATKYSELRAVVLKWSRTRNRYERQGILVQPAALEKAEVECLEDAQLRIVRAMKRQERQESLDRSYVKSFTEAIRAQYPGIPKKEAVEIAEHACVRNSGRVGRSADAKALDSHKIELAVRAAVRHRHTRYDSLLMSGADRQDARSAVSDEVQRVLEKWRAG